VALKLNISTAEHEALDDHVKPLYTADGDNFKLAVDGIEDTGALKRAKDREALAAKEAKERADLLQAELDEIKAREADADKDGKRKKGDIEALEKSWKDEKDKAVAAEVAKRERREKQLQELLVDSKADSLAHELFTVPEIGRDYIKKFLRAELDGDVPTTRVLDSMGQPTAKTLDDFKNDMLDNTALKGILVASNASGGGAGNGGGSGSGGSTKKLADMSDAERVELYKTNPTVFNQLVAAQGTT
jgi:hypothetical protein